MMRSPQRVRQRCGACLAGAVPGRAGRLLRAVGLAAALLVAGLGSATAATYKWVDENGVVHYSDRVPPEAVNRGNVELNKQGVPVRKTDPALTAEQRRAKAAEDERRQQLEKQQADAERRDRALLASYTSESEIDLSRHRALATIEAVLASAQGYQEQLTRRKAELDAQRGSRGQAASPAQEREYQGILAELAQQADLIKYKRAELAATGARYDADRARWRELSAAGRTAPVAAAGAAPAAPAPDAPRK
jgi:hypothetical protein